MLITTYPNGEIRSRLGRDVRPDKRRKLASEVRDFEMPEIPGDVSTLLDILPNSSQISESPARKKHPMSQKRCAEVLRLGACMREEDKDRQAFLTLTLPGSTEGAMTEFARLSSEAIKLIQTYVPRRLGLKGADLCFLYVWELQDRGAPHLHAVYECPTAAHAQKLVDLWHDLCVDVLRLCQEKADCDLFERTEGGSWEDCPEVWQTDAQIVEKSVARYLSKYVSKGSEGDSKYYPSRWAGASTLLHKRLKDFVDENSFCLPFHIGPWAEIKGVKDAISRAFDRFSPRGGTDCSQWFQDFSAGMFGFIPEGGSVFECIDILMEELDPFIEKDVPVNAAKLSNVSERQVKKTFAEVVGEIPAPVLRWIATQFTEKTGGTLDGTTVCSMPGYLSFSYSLHDALNHFHASYPDLPDWSVFARRIWAQVWDNLNPLMLWGIKPVEPATG